MITTKQRAHLRALANSIDPVMQIGKDGLSENSLVEINNLFEARELFKIKVLNNCEIDVRELANIIKDETNCDIIQCVGKKIVLYKKSSRKNFKHIELD